VLSCAIADACRRDTWLFTRHQLSATVFSSSKARRVGFGNKGEVRGCLDFNLRFFATETLTHKIGL
jgi:hypothetical protein